MTVTQITQDHLDQLETFFNAGDRGGFYLLYYDLTGSREALLQAHVAT